MEKGAYKRDAFKSELAELTTEILDSIKKKYAGVQVKKLGALCPTCGGAVEIQARTFMCERQCGFSIWREIASRMLKVSEAETLLRDKVVLGLKGFVNPKKSTKFEAGLKLLDTGKVEFTSTRRRIPGTPKVMSFPARNAKAACAKSKSPKGTSGPALIESSAITP